jgi:hypothetical protein
MARTGNQGRAKNPALACFVRAWLVLAGVSRIAVPLAKLLRLRSGERHA